MHGSGGSSGLATVTTLKHLAGLSNRGGSTGGDEFPRRDATPKRLGVEGGVVLPSGRNAGLAMTRGTNDGLAHSRISRE